MVNLGPGLYYIAFRPCPEMQFNVERIDSVLEQDYCILAVRAFPGLDFDIQCHVSVRLGGADERLIFSIHSEYRAGIDVSDA